MKKLLLTTLCFLFGLLTFAQTDSVEITLQKYKDLYSKGLILEQDYDKLRKKTLGIDEPTIQQPAPQKEVVIIRQDLPDTFHLTSQQLYDSGYAEAKRYFPTGGVFGGTFATTLFFSPVIGLIPAIACSSSSPKEANFSSTNPAMFKNPDYKMGYTASAKRLKVRNAWAAWGVATVLDVLVGTITGVIVSQKKK